MPQVGLQVDVLVFGRLTISGITYPRLSNIKIVIENSATNKHEEYNFKNDSLRWEQSVKPLEEDDEVTITANADGWIGNSFENTIY